MNKCTKEFAWVKFQLDDNWRGARDGHRLCAKGVDAYRAPIILVAIYIGRSLGALMHYYFPFRTDRFKAQAAPLIE